MQIFYSAMSEPGNHHYNAREAHVFQKNNWINGLYYNRHCCAQLRNALYASIMTMIWFFSTQFLFNSISSVAYFKQNGTIEMKYAVCCCQIFTDYEVCCTTKTLC